MFGNIRICERRTVVECQAIGASKGSGDWRRRALKRSLGQRRRCANCLGLERKRDYFVCCIEFMFTGLIEEVGSVLSLEAGGRDRQIRIAAPRLAESIRLGDSVAVNGCCLTVAHHRGDQLTFDLLEETLDRTNLKSLRRDSRVNLERALAADGRLGGHFVQGHVDCTARILASGTNQTDQRLDLELPAAFAHYIVSKGSIAVNGVSLTVAEMLPGSFTVCIIPHTKAQTNLGGARAGELVNLEFDLIAKYVERIFDRNDDNLS